MVLILFFFEYFLLDVYCITDSNWSRWDEDFWLFWHLGTFEDCVGLCIESVGLIAPFSIIWITFVLIFIFTVIVYTRLFTSILSSKNEYFCWWHRYRMVAKQTYLKKAFQYDPCFSFHDVILFDCIQFLLIIIFSTKQIYKPII